MTSNECIMLLIAGMPGAGKSVFVDAVSDLVDKIYTLGDIVRREAIKRNLSPDDATLGMIGIELRKKFGKGALAKILCQRIEHELSGIILVDGIRSLHEVNEFRKRLGKDNVFIIGIHASPKTRFRRLYLRKRKDDPEKWDEFIKRDMRELGYGIGDVIALSDYMIINEDIELHEFKEQAKKLVKRIIDESRSRS